MKKVNLIKSSILILSLAVSGISLAGTHDPLTLVIPPEQLSDMSIQSSEELVPLVPIDVENLHNLTESCRVFKVDKGFDKNYALTLTGVGVLGLATFGGGVGLLASANWYTMTGLPKDALMYSGTATAGIVMAGTSFYTSLYYMNRSEGLPKTFKALEELSDAIIEARKENGFQLLIESLNKKPALKEVLNYAEQKKIASGVMLNSLIIFVNKFETCEEIHKLENGPLGGERKSGKGLESLDKY